MTALTLTPGTELLVETALFRLAHGDTLPGFELPYEVHGAPGAPLIIVQGGISASCHVSSSEGNPEPGWWESFVGRGRAIDTDRYRVLSVEYLGGPSHSLDEFPGPAITSADQARATAARLAKLGTQDVHAFVGCSYGGMVGLAFAAEGAVRLGHLIAVSAPASSHPTSTAYRSLGRRLLRLGVAHGFRDDALSLARGLGLITYRSSEEFEERFALEPEWSGGSVRFPVESYLEARGAHFARRFGCEALYRLSQAIDLHRVDPRAIGCPTTVIASRSDQLVPLAQLEKLARELAGPTALAVLDSIFGHDAFLKEVDQLGPRLARALEEVPR